MHLCSIALAGILCLSACPVEGAQASPPAPAAAAPRTKPSIYDESADAAAQIKDALERARRENRRVLVQWGGNWCPWCIRLHELCASDKDIARILQYEYAVVLVDTGRPPGKNVDLARTYGADVANRGYPFLTVLDASGNAVVNQETESLEVKTPQGESAGIAAGHDPAKVLAFLKAHQAAPLVAKEVLESGVREARSSGRPVLLRFGAPWCVWCHRFDDWLRGPQVGPVVDRAFVQCTIDVDRMVGGKELLHAFRPSGEKGGIPWFAVLDGEGKVLATSTMPDGANAGFPSQDAEIAHFASVLERTAPALSGEDRAALVESLRAIGRSRPALPSAAPAGGAAAALTEEQKIERLIAHVEGLRDCIFIRNGDEHAPPDAAAHMRRKLGAQRSSVRTVDDFIRLCATKSSVSGDAYMIEFPDGRKVQCAVYLREQVAALTAPGSAP